MMRHLADKGIFQNNAMAASLESMAAGQLGMMLCTSALQSSLIAGAKGKYELRGTTEPGFGDQQAVPTNSGSGLVILRACDFFDLRDSLGADSLGAVAEGIPWASCSTICRNKVRARHGPWGGRGCVSRFATR
jgi:hypothetical protein